MLFIIVKLFNILNLANKYKGKYVAIVKNKTGKAKKFTNPRFKKKETTVNNS